MSQFPVEVGDIIAESSMSPFRAFDYRVVEILPCTPGIWDRDKRTDLLSFRCRLEYHPNCSLTSPNMDYWLNAYRYEGDRLIGYRNQPGTTGWSMYSQGLCPNGDGYDEIFIIRKAHGVLVIADKPQTAMVF